MNHFQCSSGRFPSNREEGGLESKRKGRKFSHKRGGDFNFVKIPLMLVEEILSIGQQKEDVFCLKQELLHVFKVPNKEMKALYCSLFIIIAPWKILDSTLKISCGRVHKYKYQSRTIKWRLLQSSYISLN